MALAAAFFVLAAVVQWRRGAHSSELFSHPDEPAHYVTGLMVREYLASGSYGAPMVFAEQFYARYPKVALGAWPPGFYLLQSAWSLAFSAQRASMILFMVVLTAILASLLRAAMRKDCGSLASTLGALLWLLLPLVQQHGGMIMTELPVSLFSFAAAMAFGRYFDRGRTGDAIGFSVLASLAILTKPSALSLAFVPVVAVVISRRFQVLKAPSFWLSAAVVAALCAPWTCWMAAYSRDGWDQPWPSWSYTLQAVDAYPRALAGQFGPVLVGVGAIGVWARVVVPARHRRSSGTWLSALGLIAGVLTLHCIVPVPIEARHMTPAAAPAAMFITAGVVELGRLLARISSEGIGKAIAIGLAASVFASGPFRVTRKSYEGFGRALEDLLATSVPNAPVSLISSDASGEGGFIAEIAMRQNSPRRTILRASKALSTSDWAGREYRSRFSDPRQLNEFLVESGVEVVVVDESMPPRLRRLHHDLLREALVSEPTAFELVHRYPAVRDGIRTAIALHVYRRKGRVFGLRRPGDAVSGGR
jgi:4-amino-4-deoxy-L-arabinose transferase-like glycosyltransferase